MAVPVVTAVASLIGLMVQGISDYVNQKQAVRKAVMENRLRLAKSDREFNHEWEMRQLENAGWKDDVLFFVWIGFFIWSGFFPDEAGIVLRAWESLPDWFLNITCWIVSAVLGVKKVGDYLPGVVKGVRDALGESYERR